jgi:hypothetical protein
MGQSSGDFRSSQRTLEVALFEEMHSTTAPNPPVELAGPFVVIERGRDARGELYLVPLLDHFVPFAMNSARVAVRLNDRGVACKIRKFLSPRSN